MNVVCLSTKRFLVRGSAVLSVSQPSVSWCAARPKYSHLGVLGTESLSTFSWKRNVSPSAQDLSCIPEQVCPLSSAKKLARDRPSAAHRSCSSSSHI